MDQVRARVAVLVAVLVAAGLGWGQPAQAKKEAALVVTHLSEQRQAVVVSPSADSAELSSNQPLELDPSVILLHSRHRGQVEVPLNLISDPISGSNPHRGFEMSPQPERRIHLGGGIWAMRQFNYKLSSDDKSPGLRNLGGYFELAWDF